MLTSDGTTQTLRDFVDKHIVLQPLSSDGKAPYNGTGTPFTPTRECGHTLTTGAKQPYSAEQEMRWHHPGPCEFWCDNTRLFHNENCQANNVGMVPLDRTKCTGASLIQGTLVAVHLPRWQVFTNCAMEGGKETDHERLQDVERHDRRQRYDGEGR